MINVLVKHVEEVPIIVGAKHVMLVAALNADPGQIHFPIMNVLALQKVIIIIIGYSGIPAFVGKGEAFLTPQIGFVYLVMKDAIHAKNKASVTHV